MAYPDVWYEWDFYFFGFLIRERFREMLEKIKEKLKSILR